MFKTVSTMAFISVICLFLATISVKADVTIDQKNPDRILIGPDKRFDWVEVSCISHFVQARVKVDDYCDPGPILKITYDPLEECWFIKKAHSRWVFFMDSGPDSAMLKLLDTRGN